MKKFLSELSYEEAEMLILNNTALYTSLCDTTYSMTCDYIAEIMLHFPCDYCVSAYRGDYVTLPINTTQYMEAMKTWLEDVQRSYCYFSDRDENIINCYLHNMKYFYYDADFANEAEEIEAFNTLAVAQYEAQQTILSCLQNDLSSHDDLSVLHDEFIMRLDCGMYEDYYTTEELQHVYVDIPRRVIEAHTEQIM